MDSPNQCCIDGTQNQVQSIEISDLETKVVNLHGAMSGHDEKEIAELSVGVPAEVIDIVNYLTQDAKLELADRWKSIMK